MPSESEIAQSLVQKADALIHELEKVLAQPSPKGMGFEVGSSAGISDELKTALAFLTILGNKLGWWRTRKLKNRISTIRRLYGRLSLRFPDYVEAYYKGSPKTRLLHSELNSIAASIKANAHAFAEEILKPN